MNGDDKVRYLANIYHLLSADGASECVEERAFDQISREIGAGYFEKKDAKEMALGDGYQVQFSGRWSERIRNLEDMLFAAFCNDLLESTEKKLITVFASQLGVTQQQLDIIKRETKRRYLDFKGR